MSVLDHENIFTRNNKHEKFTNTNFQIYGSLMTTRKTCDVNSFGNVGLDSELDSGAFVFRARWGRSYLRGYLRRSYLNAPIKL